MSDKDPKKYNIDYIGDRPVSITEDTSDEGSIYGFLGIGLVLVLVFLYFVVLGYLPLILSLLTGSFGSLVGKEIPAKKDSAKKVCSALLCGGLFGSVTFLGADFIEKRLYPETARDSRENILSIFKSDEIQERRRARQMQLTNEVKEHQKKVADKLLLNTDLYFE